MLGAIIGDIVGSRFEFNNIYSKEFEFFHKDCKPTDDSFMSFAVADAYMNEIDIKNSLKYYGKKYPDGGYGINFSHWLVFGNKPYNSCGNGAPMRISPLAWLMIDKKEEEIEKVVYEYTAVTHNHYEGVKAAQVQVKLIQMALRGMSKQKIEEYAKSQYRIPDRLHKMYFSELSQETMPIAIRAFLDSTSFEDAIRNAISVGGDSDTIACITGAIAEAYYGIPEEIKNKAYEYLDNDMKKLLKQYYSFNKY